ncbi:uncharacterized protein OCT59_023586 [Rhizophagus irregularis]|uniref:Skt5p n=2 Tax=Rhizophagus irregularis TaxID=588596 RepID=A0A015JK32_RHIIW|nr:Skt5p [Rhizophagus irregularis DAOM 197198w]UZO03176.1 hypothetical protein OCT59_023586 [Rhizophagus irregularis]GBC20551.1 kinase-like domain-containing protein [Rhizophagus irregularis DAOM 181602=DAOM 197198]
MSDKQLNSNSNNVDSSNIQISLSQIIQNFYKTNIKEKQPTTQNINEIIFEEELGIVVDNLVNLCFKEINEGKEEIVIKQHVIDYINNHKLDSHEFYKWLLNNQNDSNSIYLLGYLNYYGIQVNVNRKQALKLYQKATNLGNIMAQYNIANMYIDGEGVEKNYDKAFELSKKLAEKGYSSGMNLLGYCYDKGIGAGIDNEKAVKLFQKAANLKNNLAQYNLALMYEFGKGTDKDIYQAIHWYKKSAEQGDKFAQDKLKELSTE